MPNTKEIKNRIEGVNNTHKITNAMYLIALTKMRKARKDLDEVRPYFDALQDMICMFVGADVGGESKFFKLADEELPKAYLLFTGDKGLVGSYHQSLLKELEATLAKAPDSKVFVIGDYGRRYLSQHSIPFEQEFLDMNSAPNLDDARLMCSRFMEGFLSGSFGSLDLIYMDLGAALHENVCSEQVLPISRSKFEGGDCRLSMSSYEFVPTADAVLDNIMPNYLTGFIYGAMVDSFCCEQVARMTAMDSANQNAKKLVEELRVEYNNVRQGAITREITEISAAARQQKKVSLKNREAQKND